MQDQLVMGFTAEHEGLEANVLKEGGREIPGSVQYAVRRFEKPHQWIADDAALLSYQYVPNRPAANFLELRYCVTGNMYCRKDTAACSQCRAASASGCEVKIDTVDVVSFVFSPDLLGQFVKSRADSGNLGEQLLSFRYKSSFSRSISLCSRTRIVLDNLLNHTYSGSLENIFVSAQAQMLLLQSLDCMDEKEIDVVSCKFLNNDADREKILKAREILLQQIGSPITIRQLSRRVAMNECYLKKGFKEMFGTTIFEFYQTQRMEHAKYLLYEKGLSVTDVSVLLGYSSISHFSTAFKKHTGLKPCELLK